MYGPPPESGTPPPPAPGRDATRSQRHAYLVGRLHNRQMTMEEATELFTIMQSMLQASEAARAALMRVPPPPTPMGPMAPPPRPAAPASAVGDDLLLVGLLAMGATAGLLAAMSKRIQEATPPVTPTPRSRPDSDTASPKG